MWRMRAVVLLPNVDRQVGQVGAALEDVLGPVCDSRSRAGASTVTRAIRSERIGEPAVAQAPARGAPLRPSRTREEHEHEQRVRADEEPRARRRSTAPSERRRAAGSAAPARAGGRYSAPTSSASSGRNSSRNARTSLTRTSGNSVRAAEASSA